MSDIENSDLLKLILKALYTTAARRTTQNFAIAIIDAILRTLEEKYDFFKDVRIIADNQSEDFIYISSDINNVHPLKIGKAIEAIIQIVYMDLREKAGLYFIKEVKLNAGEEIISKLRESGVDLELLMLQQHYLYKRQQRKNPKIGTIEGESEKTNLDNISLLGYTEENISSWHYDPNKKVCIIFDKNGRELDQLNLDTIIKGYVGFLTKEGVIESREETGKKEENRVALTEKEFELLKLLHARDVDIKTAIGLLKISEAQLNYMVRRLLTLEYLHYV